MSTLTRAFLDGILPKGSAFRVQAGGGLDQIIGAMSDNMGTEVAQVAALQFVRDPNYTAVFEDLERELGIQKNPYLTQAQRTVLSSRRKFSKASGTLPGLQAELDAAGFGNGGYGLTVYDNNGAANPNNFVGGVAWMQAGYNTPGYYQAGNTYAFAGLSGGGGTLIVNGLLTTAAPAYWGAGMFQANQTVAIAGYFTQLTFTPVQYTIPTDPGFWPSFFFLGQNPVYAAGTLQTLQAVNVPNTRQSELIELVTRIKPMGTWCVGMINWI